MQPGLIAWKGFKTIPAFLFGYYRIYGMKQ